MLKKFERKHADVFQGFEHAAGGVFGGALEVGIKAGCGGEREAENTAAVVILNERVDSGFGVAGADRENGEFAGEGDETFENEGDSAETITQVLALLEQEARS